MNNQILFPLQRFDFWTECFLCQGHLTPRGSQRAEVNHPTLHWPQLGIKGSLRSFSPWNSFFGLPVAPWLNLSLWKFYLAKDVQRCRKMPSCPLRWTNTLPCAIVRRCIFQHPNFSYFACLVTESRACLQKLEICGQGTIAMLPAVYCSPCYGGWWSTKSQLF